MRPYYLYFVGPTGRIMGRDDIAAEDDSGLATGFTITGATLLGSSQEGDALAALFRLPMSSAGTVSVDVTAVGGGGGGGGAITAVGAAATVSQVNGTGAVAAGAGMRA